MIISLKRICNHDCSSVRAVECDCCRRLRNITLSFVMGFAGEADEKSPSWKLCKEPWWESTVSPRGRTSSKTGEGGEGDGGAKSTFPDGLERTNLSAPPSVYSESQFRSSIKRMNSPCLPSAVVGHCFFIPRVTLDSGLLSHVCSGSCQGLFSLSVFC